MFILLLVIALVYFIYSEQLDEHYIYNDEVGRFYKAGVEKRNMILHKTVFRVIDNSKKVCYLDINYKKAIKEIFNSVLNKFIPIEHIEDKYDETDIDVSAIVIGAHNMNYLQTLFNKYIQQFPKSKVLIVYYQPHSDSKDYDKPAKVTFADITQTFFNKNNNIEYIIGVEMDISNTYSGYDINIALKSDGIIEKNIISYRENKAMGNSVSTFSVNDICDRLSRPLDEYNNSLFISKDCKFTNCNELVQCIEDKHPEKLDFIIMNNIINIKSVNNNEIIDDAECMIHLPYTHSTKNNDQYNIDIYIYVAKKETSGRTYIINKESNPYNVQNLIYLNGYTLVAINRKTKKCIFTIYTSLIDGFSLQKDDTRIKKNNCLDIRRVNQFSNIPNLCKPIMGIFMNFIYYYTSIDQIYLVCLINTRNKGKSLMCYMKAIGDYFPIISIYDSDNNNQRFKLDIALTGDGSDIAKNVNILNSIHNRKPYTQDNVLDIEKLNMYFYTSRSRPRYIPVTRSMKQLDIINKITIK